MVSTMYGRAGLALRDDELNRLWSLIELLDQELTSPYPDWQRVRAASKELWKRVKRAT
jgi:hypothetical protein